MLLFIVIAVLVFGAVGTWVAGAECVATGATGGSCG